MKTTNKTKSLIPLLLILSLSLASAIVVYSGESETITLPEAYSYYSIVGNTTEVNLDIVQNGNNVTITPDKYSMEDSYEIVFFNLEKEIIVEYHHSSGGNGGGTRIIYRDRNVTQEVVVDSTGDDIFENITAIGSDDSGEAIPWWVILVMALIILGTIIYGYFLIFGKEDKDNDERRFEEIE